MDFIYGNGGISIGKNINITHWSFKEINDAKPRAIKLLLQDMEGYE